jgi:nucleoside-diphosphate-sugar epimerase
MSPKVLVTGAAGQIGTELVRALRRRLGTENILATDKSVPSGASGSGPFSALDVLDGPALEKAIKDRGIDTVYHLAAILSAVGEENPDIAWEVNVKGLKNVLDASVRGGVRRLFWPSSIGVFGPDAPKIKAPQATPLNPTTMYGVTKVAGELLCNYYSLKYGLDVRSIRFPGLISSEARPGGGTTDYAVEMFYSALHDGTYTCFLKEDTTLPMMYMPDALRGAIQLMEADRRHVRLHSGYNLAAMSFTPGSLASEIKKHLPRFRASYIPDRRQKIADSWPSSIDDSAARDDWGWHEDYDLPRTVVDMLARLQSRMSSGKDV